MNRPTPLGCAVLLFNAVIGFAVFLLSVSWAGIAAPGLGFDAMIASLCCGPALWGRFARAVLEEMPEEVHAE